MSATEDDLQHVTEEDGHPSAPSSKGHAVGQDGLRGARSDGGTVPQDGNVPAPTSTGSAVERDERPAEAAEGGRVMIKDRHIPAPPSDGLPATPDDEDQGDQVVIKDRHIPSPGNG